MTPFMKKTGSKTTKVTNGKKGTREKCLPKTSHCLADVHKDHHHESTRTCRALSDGITIPRCSLFFLR